MRAELEVFQLIGMGLSRSEIAAQLHISNKTVETHRLPDQRRSWKSRPRPARGAQQSSTSATSRRASRRGRTRSRLRRSPRRPQIPDWNMMSSPALSLIFCDHDEQIDDKYLPGRAAQAGTRKSRSVVIAGGERRSALRTPGCASTGASIRTSSSRAGAFVAIEGCQILNHSCVDGAPASRLAFGSAHCLRLNRIEARRPPTLLVELSALLWKDGLHGAALSSSGSCSPSSPGRETFELISVHSRDTFRSRVRPGAAALDRFAGRRQVGADSRGSGGFEAVGPIESILIIEDDPDFFLEPARSARAFQLPRDRHRPHAQARRSRRRRCRPARSGRSGHRLERCARQRRRHDSLAPAPTTRTGVVYLTGRSDEETHRRIRRRESRTLAEALPGRAASSRRQARAGSAPQRTAGARHRARSYAASAHESLQHLLAELHDQVGQPLVESASSAACSRSAPSRSPPPSSASKSW